MKNQADDEMDELRPEYDMRELLRGGVRGKYLERYQAGTNLILLAPDVARFFPDEKAVNDALRLVLQLTRIPASAEPADAGGRESRRAPRREAGPVRYHLTFVGDGWRLRREGSDRAAKTFPTKGEATRGAAEYVKEKGGSLIVHKKDGRFQEERTYPGSGDTKRSRD